MYHWLIICFFVFVCFTTKAQQYRLVYDKDMYLPELYNEIAFTVQKKVGTVYLPLKKKHKLFINKKSAYKKVVELDKQLLYEKDGQVNACLVIEKDSVFIDTELPILKSIEFNLYADSIKPILNYYLNIEGTFNNNTIYPLNESLVTLSCNHGTLKGMEWIKPEVIDFDTVTFTAVCKYDASIAKHITVHIKQDYDEKSD